MKLLFCLVIILSIVKLIRLKTFSDFKVCRECVSNSFNYAWCSDKNFTGSRCQVKTRTHQCSINLYKSKFSMTIASQKPLQGGANPIQITPQVIKIKARQGDEIDINISYKPHKHEPLDVYYLMDGSDTMREYKKKLGEQALQIHDALKNYSNNVFFGAGTFVEKRALPYTRSNDYDTYPFRNHLRLSGNIEEFKKVVPEVPISGNLDNPESGLDALMQVMTCIDDIGWRKNSRRIIVVSTDGTYHSAGDGKMAGAIKPNDMKCHYDKKNGTYDYETSIEYDYPSVSQINKVASDNDINIIFAVVSKVENEYKMLAQKIKGAIHVNFAADLDIIKIITKKYTELRNNLEIDRSQVPSFINLTLTPECTKDNPGKLVHDTAFNFTATIKFNQCPKEKLTQFAFGPIMKSNDQLKVIVESQCECDCEKLEEVNSTKCNYNGKYQCGVCICNPQRYGDHCECEGPPATPSEDLAKCRASKNDSPCSGLGSTVCRCGKCWCGENYGGLYCQLSTTDCKTEPKTGTPCYGNGNCQDNTCSCKPGWTGSACECSLDKNDCIGPNSKECSGNGKCECGSCACSSRNAKNKPYFGTFCHDCESCQEERCKALEDIAECNYHSDQATCDIKHNPVNNRTVRLLSKVEINTRKWKKGNWIWCKKSINEFILIFKYQDGLNSTMILVQKERELAPKPNIWIPIVSAIGAILLIGMLTVVAWKILVDIHDAREYRNLTQSAATDGYDVSLNPLYQSPEINIMNPSYTGNS